jgi:uncharacterized protein YjaZ
MFYSKDKIANLSKYMLNKISKIIYKFCINVIGYKKKRFPTITLSYIKSDIMGEYDPFENKIIIYIKGLKNVGELTSTIIHEYTHSQQNILGKYSKLYKKHGYIQHPMEIEARDNEKLYNRKALNFLRNEW